jgi:hypothetical protein
MLDRFLLGSGSTFVGLGCLVLLAGCAKKDDGRLGSYPVRGKVTVDGEPTKGVYVFLVPEKQPATHGIYPNAITDEHGVFWVSTYDSEDGAPLGEYTVTAKWPKGEGLMVNSDSPDRLDNRYTDPKTSTIKITVKEATKANPNEVPPLELNSK